MREFFFGVVKFVSYEKGFSINSLLLRRHGGLMISEVDARSRGLHLQPGLCWTQGQEVWVPVNVLCSCAKHFTLTVSVSTQEYKWVAKISQGNLIKCKGGERGGGRDNGGMDLHPVQGWVVILPVASCEEARIN